MTYVSKYIRNNQSSIVLIFFSFLFAFVISWISISANHDGDLFWHAAMGRDFIERGLSPLRDHYSFTYNGHSIVLPPVPFQVLLYFFQTAFGEFVGAEAINVVFRLVPFFLFVVLILRQKVSLIISTSATVFFAWAVSFRGLVRPEITSYLFCFLFVQMALEARQRFTYRRIATMLAVLVIWNNVHITSMFGFIIFSALVGERALNVVLTSGSRRQKSRSLFKLFLLGVFGLALGFLNPSLVHPVIFAFKTSPAFQYLIQEHKEAKFFAQQPFEYIFWIFSAISVVWSLIKKRWFFLLVTLAVGYQSFRLEKIFPNFIIITVPFLMTNVPEVYAEIRGSVRKVFAAICLIGTLAIVVDLCSNAYVSRPLRGFSSRVSSEGIANYMIKNGVKGRILASHELAPFLSYRFGTDVSIYIDGRTNVLYPIEHMIRYNGLATSLDFFEKQVHQYDIRHAFLSVLYDTVPLLDNAVKSGLFSIAYQEGGQALLTREKGPFPVGTRLFVRPECWNGSYAFFLKEEEKKAADILPSNSELGFIISYAAAYATAIDKRQFFSRPQAIPSTAIRTLRFLGYLAMISGYPEMALYYYSSIERPSTKDKLYIISAHIEMNKFKEAHTLIKEIIDEKVTSGFELSVISSLQKKLPVEYRVSTNMNPNGANIQKREDIYKKQIKDIGAKVDNFCMVPM